MNIHQILLFCIYDPSDCIHRMESRRDEGETCVQMFDWSCRSILDSFRATLSFEDVQFSSSPAQHSGNMETHSESMQPDATMFDSTTFHCGNFLFFNFLMFLHLLDEKTIFDDFLSSNKWLGFSNCCDLIPSPPLSAAGGSAPGYWLRELRSAGLQLRKKRAAAGTRHGQLCFFSLPLFLSRC